MKNKIIATALSAVLALGMMAGCAKKQAPATTAAAPATTTAAAPAGVTVSWSTLVDAIVVPEGDTRCRLEEIVADASTATEAEALLRRHFAEKAAHRKSN